MRGLNRLIGKINTYTKRRWGHQEPAGTIDLGFHVCPRCVFTWDGDQVVAVVDCGSPLHRYLTGAQQWDNQKNNTGDTL